MNDITQLSACTLIKMIREKTISAVEVSQVFIDRIQLINPSINAIHQVDPERILSQAKLADQAIASKRSLGRLHGLPISIKDTCYVKGFINRKGSYLLPETISVKNATVVDRLISEGAIILGITNVPEMLAAYETDNLIYGRTNNPHDLTRQRSVCGKLKSIKCRLFYG